MENKVAVGKNRTGAQMAPVGSKDVEQFAQSRLGAGSRDGAAFAQVHRDYIREADRVGSVPVPATLKGMATTIITGIKGDKASVFIDKLGERAAFERTGVRLYEALLIKCAEIPPGSSPVDPAALQSQLLDIRNEEEAHFRLVSQAIETLGGDPTAMTPCADVAAVSGTGWLQVMTDPRTTLAQALNTMISAELTDKEGWDMLIELAAGVGQDELAQRFKSADAAEGRHVEMVRSLLKDILMSEAT